MISLSAACEEHFGKVREADRGRLKLVPWGCHLLWDSIEFLGTLCRRRETVLVLER